MLGASQVFFILLVYVTPGTMVAILTAKYNIRLIISGKSTPCCVNKGWTAITYSDELGEGMDAKK
jgi:hypothetical protein